MKIFLILLFFSSFGYGQTKMEWNNENFIRVEVDMGGYHSIRLFEEGILCKSINSKLKPKLNFFPTNEINYKALVKLQIYLLENLDVLKDTILDVPNQRIFSSYSLKIVFTQGEKTFNILWLDGENEKFEIILKLLNDVIPFKYQKLYYIIPSWL